MRRDHLVIVLLAAISACQRPVQQQLVSIESQGVHIDYTDSGQGDTTLLFVHGWAINKTYWEEQVMHFSPKYRVVTMDLPGFGMSGKNRRIWSPENYAADVDTLIKVLGCKNVILIGHSMSEAVITATVLRDPHAILGLVGIDNFKYVKGITSPAVQAQADSFYRTMRKDFHNTVTSFVSKELFSPSTDSAARKRILQDMTSADSSVAVDCIATMDSYKLADHLSQAHRALFLINSSFTPTDTAFIGAMGIPYHLYDIGPTGHYPMIERPAAFDSLLQLAIYAIGHMPQDIVSGLFPISGGLSLAHERLSSPVRGLSGVLFCAALPDRISSSKYTDNYAPAGYPVWPGYHKRKLRNACQIARSHTGSPENTDG